MLEDLRMEKKSINRSSQMQSRAAAVDCKKNSDSNQKIWPRNNKKREGAGNSSKNDPNRKSLPPQRGRGPAERRPRPRGSAGYVLGGMESSGVADDEPELGSVFVPGCKKQNFNHLLNFMYTPRGGSERSGGPPARKNVPQRSTSSHPHNTDLYLQACCQFVVKEDGDYKLNLLDPDVPVKWEFIEEIVVRSSGKSECPICLGAPVAGRVGRCGHVYCWPCALHYAASHDKQPPPCPVCAAPFKVELMKPARIVQWGLATEEVSMRLVRRVRGSTMVELAPPRGLLTEAASEDSIQSFVNINNAPYSKLFAANREQVCNIMERERKELENQILNEIDTTEVEYIEQALALLKKQRKTYEKSPTLLKQVILEKEVDITPPIDYQKETKNEMKYDWFDLNDDEGAKCIEPEAPVVESTNDDVTTLTENLKNTTLNPDAPEFELNENAYEEFPLVEEEPLKNDADPMTDIDKENQAKYFYFYQAEDGQQLFLNSLNVRILNASWGSLAAAPLTIRGRVLHRESSSLNEQTRKHMPYTAHLPLHCPFDIVELELNPPFVTDAALHSYADDLDRRARIRARLHREEKRRERAYHRAVEGPPRPDFSSELLFPPTASPKYSSPPVEPVLEPVASASAMPSPSPSGLSFAKMASSSGTWRVRSTPSARPLTPPPADDDPSAPAAPRALCLSDAIEAALHAAPKPAVAGKKNKKSKTKVLFATGMQRAD